MCINIKKPHSSQTVRNINHTVRELYIFLKPDTNWVGFFLETVVYVPSLCTAWFRKPIIHSERICTNWILSVFKFNDYVHDFVIF